MHKKYAVTSVITAASSLSGYGPLMLLGVKPPVIFKGDVTSLHFPIFELDYDCSYISLVSTDASM